MSKDGKNIQANEKDAFLNFQISSELHEELRKCAFENRISIAQICREGVELALKKYQRK